MKRNNTRSLRFEFPLPSTVVDRALKKVDVFRRTVIEKGEFELMFFDTSRKVPRTWTWYSMCFGTVIWYCTWSKYKKWFVRN